MMVIPEIAGVESPDWWRALLVVAYNTGLRRRSLFELRIADVDWRFHRVDLPPCRMKSRRAQTVHLNPTAMVHLERFKTDRVLVFPWPYNLRHFHTTFHRLQWDAGLPRKSHFGLSNLRKTCATTLWAQSPEAAQLVLGHVSIGTTQTHYVQGTDIAARALDGLPQPQAFGE